MICLLMKDLAISGRVSRGEAGLLARSMSANIKVTAEDEVLLEVLKRVGVWLVR